MEILDTKATQSISIYDVSNISVVFPKFKQKSTPQVSVAFPQTYMYYMVAILYYLTYIPFRFEKASNSQISDFEDKIQLYSNRLQKVFCIAMHTVLLTLTVYLLATTFGPDEQGNIYANTMLDSTIVLVGSAMIWYFCYTVWFCQTDFLILAQINENTASKFAKLKYKVKERIQNYIAEIIPVLLLLSSAYQFFTANLNHQCVPHSTQFWFKMLFILQLVLYNFPDYVFNSSEEEKESIKVNIVREYYQLDEFVNQLNDKFGFWILIHMVLGIPYLSQKSVEFFKGSTSFSAVVLNIPVMFAQIFFLFVAAGATQKIDASMRKFLRDNEENVRYTNNQVSILLSKLNNNPIGLRGKNFFVITYTFVGSVISVIITLAFIDQRNSSTRFGKDLLGSQTLNSSLAGTS